MPRLKWLFSLVACAGLSSLTLPVRGQALLPYVPKIDSERLEQHGLELLQDAIQLIKFQQYELALPRAELSTQLAPGSYEAWFILGSLYVQQDELARGIRVLEKAQVLAPTQEGILFTLGNAYFQQGNYQAALKKLEAGLKLQSNAPEALFDLGNTYLKLDKFSKAVSAYEKAFNQEKSFWPAINNVGLVEYEQGNVDKAIKKWQQALSIDGKQAEPKLALAVALHNQGKTQQGIELGISALKVDNRYADLEFLRENLWGERLLEDTKVFLATPQIQAIVSSYQEQPEAEESLETDIIP